MKNLITKMHKPTDTEINLFIDKLDKFGVGISLIQNEEVYLIPFMLEEIGINSDLMQPDGIHPNKKAQSLIAKDVKKNIDKFLLINQSN